MKKIYVFSIVILAVLAVVLPVLSTSTVNVSRGGRVFKYTAIMTAEKDPPDDPWGVNPAIFVENSNYVWTGFQDVRVVAPSCCWEGPFSSFQHADTQIFSWLSEGPEPWISSVWIVSTFSFSSNIHDEIGLVYEAYSYQPGYYDRSVVLYLPPRWFRGGVTYKWTIKFNMYNTDKLRVMPLVPASNKRFFANAPINAYCAFTGGGGSVGLKVATSRYILNITHAVWSASITFTDSFWNDRNIRSCVLYINNNDVINAINTLHYSTISQLWILYIEPGITVTVGDRIVVDVYVVVPPNV